MPRKRRDPRPGDPLPRLPYGEGSLSWEKARPGIMALRWVHEGKRYVERGRTRAEVDAKRRRRLEALTERAGYVEGSLGDLCERWLTDTRRAKGDALAATTDDGYVRDIAHVLRGLGADTPVLELDRAKVRGLLVDLAHEPARLGRGALHSVRYTLSMVCEYGLDAKMLGTNPVRGVKLPEAAARPREKRWFDLDGYAKVLDHLLAEPTPVNLLYLTMLQAGLRPGEARALRWDAVDLEAGTLRVETAMRKGRDGKMRPSSTLKTDRHGDAARRTVRLTPELAAALRRERRAQRLRGEASEAVFASVTLHEHNTNAARIAQATGAYHVDQRTGERHVVNPNGYRHTFASVCRHRGMPYEVLAKLMGHKTVRMIVEVYGHPIVDPASVDMGAYLGREGALPYLEEPAEEG